MKIINGTNKNPKSDSLYCVFCRDLKGFSIGRVIRGDDCNWNSSEIIGYSELPFLMSEEEYLGFRIFGEISLRDDKKDSGKMALKATNRTVRNFRIVQTGKHEKYDAI